MADTGYVIRAPKDETEIAAFYDNEARGTQWDAAIHGPLPDYQRMDTTNPGFSLDDLRCVFDGDKLIGGCLVGRRETVVDGVSLTTGCVGGVFTHHQYRHQGIGRLLMEHVNDYSRERGDALLLLDGIPDYYHRWGYVDVFDVNNLFINVERINGLSEPSLNVNVREATVDDAPALLDLYRRHHIRYTGRFVRDLAYERHLLSSSEYGNTYLRVVDGPDGDTLGYSFHSRRYPNRSFEVVAADWDSLSALLHHHVASLPANHEITDLRWTAPPGSNVALMLADHLPLRQETPREPDSGWMARIVNLDQVIAAMAPVWARRWRDLVQADRHLAVQVGDATLRIGPDSVTVRNEAADSEARIKLSEPSFTQLLFGFRSVEYLATLPENSIPVASIEPLHALFPELSIWIAATDYF